VTSGGTAAALWALLFLFALRVLGQLLVFLGLAPWLPPMKDWYSGLLPYGPLLVSQIVIIGAFGTACVEVTHRRGYFGEPKAWLGRGLLIFGSVYFAAMVVRYAAGVGPMIPIYFHWVLASFLLVLGAYHRRGGTRT
jgi:hypothetical protein